MKKTFLLVLFTAIVFCSFSQEAKPKKSDATVEQVLGLYVFVDATPKLEYQFLGSVSAGSGFGKAMVGAPEYDAKKMKLINKAKDEYPQADGVILHFARGGKDTADAIKFKD